MSNNHILSGILCLVLLGASSCEQSAPPVVEEKGDIFFSGYYWKLKDSDVNRVGPGPNRFSKSTDNIWLDANGMLHLKITKRNNIWYCSEAITVKEFGYGTYVFTTASDLTIMKEKEVLGLFTWNDYSFQQEGNSEIDVELARWNNTTDSLLLTYSVQPVWFSQPAPYAERTRKPQMQVSKLKRTCTHVMKWTPTLVTWESFEGDSYPTTATPIASWSFDDTNISRRKLEGNRTSEPIIIPGPADSTNARINLWLLNGQAPANNQETEVVIKSFRYIPL